MKSVIIFNRVGTKNEHVFSGNYGRMERIRATHSEERESNLEFTFIFNLLR